MDARRAAEAAEDLAELSPAAAAALLALRRAADPAQTLSQLVAGVHAILVGFDRETLPIAGLAAILAALDGAHDRAAVVLHESIPRPKLRQCVEATAGLVALWSMTPVERAAIEFDCLADSVALACLLRNTVESLLLVDGMNARAEQRRQGAVDRIKADALAGYADGSADVDA